MKPKRDLPPYAAFAEAPFSIERGTVVQIMRQFREEGVLPQQKIQRRWSSLPGPRWTSYDSDIFCYLREMRALRYDQAEQVLLESAEARHDHLSPSHISNTINHWINDGYAVYQHIYGEKIKWIIPTRKGLSYAGFNQCAKILSEKTLKHLYWVNAVRITLEEKFVAMTWFSKRDIRAEEVIRGEKHHWQHIPDAQVTSGDGKEFFDIEVQVSRPSPHAVERIMLENLSGRKKNPLHYYVTKKSERVVREVYDTLVKEECPIRSHIEIIDLETFLQG